MTVRLALLALALCVVAATNPIAERKERFGIGTSPSSLSSSSPAPPSASALDLNFNHFAASLAARGWPVERASSSDPAASPGSILLVPNSLQVDEQDDHEDHYKANVFSDSSDSSSSLLSWLTVRGLERHHATLDDFGCSTPDDLRFLEAQDLVPVIGLDATTDLLQAAAAVLEDATPTTSTASSADSTGECSASIATDLGKATALHRQGALFEAERRYRLLVASLRICGRDQEEGINSVGGGNNEGLTKTLSRLGMLLSQSGRHEEALEAFEEVLALGGQDYPGAAHNAALAEAAIDPAAYVTSPSIPIAPSRHAVMEMAVSLAVDNYREGGTDVSFLALEFGVYEGASLGRIAELAQLALDGQDYGREKKHSVEVHGFDSFAGLPEDWVYAARRRDQGAAVSSSPPVSVSNNNNNNNNNDDNESAVVIQRAGQFALRAIPGSVDDLPAFSYGGEGVRAVPLSAKIHPGWFNETVPAFVEERLFFLPPGGQPHQRRRRRVSLVHIDCDLYSSTLAVLEALACHLDDGTVVVFDEAFGYPGWRDHEMRAWQEVTSRFRIQWRHHTHYQMHLAVVVAGRAADENCSGD